MMTWIFYTALESSNGNLQLHNKAVYHSFYYLQ
jgi:hypothetical protein